jgi:multisubunit Na+/H+ antiporter MnhE subunit
MRKVLRIADDGPRGSIMGAQNALSGSIAISGIRCIFTYILIPLVGPVVGLGGSAPVLGLALGAVSTVFIVMSMRRFFAADHKWRWGYASVGMALIVLVIVQSAFDIAQLLGT